MRGVTPPVQLVGSGTVEQPWDICAGAVDVAGGVGDGEHMGQQLAPGRLAGRVCPWLSGYRMTQQSASDRRHIVVTGGVERVVTDDGLHQPVELETIRAYPG